jgi:hypothetical protein
LFSALTKYRHAFLIGLQSNLVYRWNFAVRGFFSMFHLAVVFILWGAVYAGVKDIGGFSFGQTLTYFLVMLVMQFFVGAFNAHQLFPLPLQHLPRRAARHRRARAPAAPHRRPTAPPLPHPAP